MGLSYTMETYELEFNKTENRTLIGLFGGYSGNGLRVGGEYDIYTHSLGDINSTYAYNLHINTEITSQIMAFYASYKITSKLEGLVRYDMYDPNTDEIDEGKDNSTYLIAGIQLSCGNGLLVAPNIRVESYEDDLDSATEYKINFQFKF